MFQNQLVFTGAIRKRIEIVKIENEFARPKYTSQLKTYGLYGAFVEKLFGYMRLK